MAEKSADSSPTSPLSLLLGEQTPGSPARSLKPRYLKSCSSKSIDLGTDWHPLNRLKKLSSFGSDSLGEISAQTAQGDEKKLAQLYEAKLKRLQQKVTDLTRLYRESERDAQQKLQFWQSKFLSTFQALKSSQSSELSAEALQQLNGKIGSLEQQIDESLGQGGEEELRAHRFNKEMLSKLKSSHQEKKQLIDQLTQFNDKFSTISTSMDAYTHKLDSLLIDGDADSSVKRELENARSTIERLVRERAQLEEVLSRLQTGSGELISSGLVLCDNVGWITFHSGYDFGYLLKLLTCQNLPVEESEFFDLLRLYFPKVYDVKYIMKSCKNLKGGLQEVADTLVIERIGEKHQAGSDSNLTGAAFFRMKQMFFEGEIDDEKYNGYLYGLGPSFTSGNTMANPPGLAPVTQAAPLPPAPATASSAASGQTD